MKVAKTRRSTKLARKLGFYRHDNGVRSRIYSLTLCRDPWWQWGHRLMILTGTNEGGNWSEPEPPTWWYRRSETKRMWRTGYPRVRSFEIIRGDYAEFQRRTDGLNEDQMYEWQALNISQDGELQLGHRYWGGSFYGMRKDEVHILRSYLRAWHRMDWFGARSWLWSQGLHHAVNGYRPGACGVVPPRESSGYSHWHCECDRRHIGPHRFRAYEWVDGGDVVYVPQSETGTDDREIEACSTCGGGRCHFDDHGRLVPSREYGPCGKHGVA